MIYCIEKKFLLIILNLILLAVESVSYADARFVEFKVNQKNHETQLYLKDETGVFIGTFDKLNTELKSKGKSLIFAMNAGIFMQDQNPLGLFIKDEVTIKKLSTKKKGFGNFYLQPNGIFLISNNQGYVVATDEYLSFSKNHKVKFATQSGPMLLKNGEINPLFRKGSNHTNIRNGVCVDYQGNVLFSLSKVEVSFFEMANHFKNDLGCKDALYFDGAISKIYWPKNGYYSSNALFGPLIGITVRQHHNFTNE